MRLLPSWLSHDEGAYCNDGRRVAAFPTQYGISPIARCSCVFFDSQVVSDAGSQFARLDFTMNTVTKEKLDENRDPITGEPGSHPLGTGIGSAGAAAAGAAIGVLGGPVGMAIGGVVGAIAGGIAGHKVAESLDPTTTDNNWSDSDGTPNEDDDDISDYETVNRVDYDSMDRDEIRSFDDDDSEQTQKLHDKRTISRLS